MTTEPPAGDRAVVRLFGVMLMIVGFLMMALSGLCSLGFLGATLLEVFRAPGNGATALPMVPLIAIFGGGPMACGFGVFALGRALRRDLKQKGDRGTTFN